MVLTRHLTGAAKVELISENEVNCIECEHTSKSTATNLSKFPAV